jgi:hypothetical protein
VSHSKITTCTCASSFQDSAHGRGLRVHNQTAKGFRCSVCGVEKIGGGTASESEVKSKKKGKK